MYNTFVAIADALRAHLPSLPPAERPLFVALADALSTGNSSHLLNLLRNGRSISAGFNRLDAVRRRATGLLADNPAAAGPIADIVAEAQRVLIAEEETMLRRSICSISALNRVF